MSQRHTFTHSDERPSEIQRGLDDYDRDTIAYLAAQGVSDALLVRVVKGMSRESQKPERHTLTPEQLRELADMTYRFRAERDSLPDGI